MAGTRRDAEIPRLWYFTDPDRSPDAIAIVGRLPRGAAVVYRAFGAEDRLPTARALRALTRSRGLRLLIGADEDLAGRVGADGIHLPERMNHRIGPLKRYRPDWFVSVAAHGRAAIQKGQGADAVVVSAVFPSRSPSAGPPLGAIRFAFLVRASRAPVIALGGVNIKNAPRLVSTGAAGLAAIEGFSAAD